MKSVFSKPFQLIFSISYIKKVTKIALRSILFHMKTSQRRFWMSNLFESKMHKFIAQRNLLWTRKLLRQIHHMHWYTRYKGISYEYLEFFTLGSFSSECWEIGSAYSITEDHCGETNVLESDVEWVLVCLVWSDQEVGLGIELLSDWHFKWGIIMLNLFV